MVRIEVIDTGVGIAPEDQALIFEEFRQVQGDLTRQHQGTGLGLPISKRLVEMHGGQMGLDSTPGKGSCFFFTLPVHPPAPAVPTTMDIPTPTTYDATRPLIVVVDDDPTSQEILQHCLDEGGYRTHAVLDSRDALMVIRQMQPQLVILDVLMAHLDGWEVLEQLKGTSETAAIPVIICSIVDQQHLGVSLGASEYLLKPIREEILVSRITELLQPPATVLVIDDDSDARKIIRTTLTEHRYHIVEASNGAAGLEAIERRPPDLVVLDLMMPEMDGFTVLEHLRLNSKHAAVPVVVVTAKDLETHERQWLRERTFACLQKSQFSPDEFMSHVSHILHTRRR